MNYKTILGVSAACVAALSSAWLIRPDGTGEILGSEVMTLFGIDEATYVQMAKAGEFDVHLVRDATYDIPCTKDGGQTVQWFSRGQRIDADINYKYNPSTGNLHLRGFGEGYVQNNTYCPGQFVRLKDASGQFVPAIMTSADTNTLTLNGVQLSAEMRQP